MTDIANNRVDVILAESEMEDGVPIVHIQFSRGSQYVYLQLSVTEAGHLLEKLQPIVNRGRNLIRDRSLEQALEGSHVRLIGPPYEDPFEGSRED
jgi:hypothetical protein